MSPSVLVHFYQYLASNNAVFNDILCVSGSLIFPSFHCLVFVKTMSSQSMFYRFSIAGASHTNQLL